MESKKALMKETDIPTVYMDMLKRSGININNIYLDIKKDEINDAHIALGKNKHEHIIQTPPYIATELAMSELDHVMVREVI